MKESDLFDPVRKYLEGQGYLVHAEVKDCDLLARKGDELLVVELKTGFSLALVYQGIERQERCDSVYLAIPLSAGRQAPPNYSSMKSLCRRLGLGLILVRFLKRSTRVEIVLHPGDHGARTSHQGRRAIIREIDGRYAEFTKGGLASKEAHMSAYRQQALVCAHLLEQRGPSSPSSLVKVGGPARAQIILAGNVFGWFDKVERGIYSLSEEGRLALGHYSQERDTLAGCVAETAPSEAKPKAGAKPKDTAKTKPQERSKAKIRA